MAGNDYLAFVAILGLVLVAPRMLHAKHPDGHPGEDAASAQRVEEANLRDTIIHLQHSGSRMSFEQQWNTARWAAARMEKYGLKTTIESYEYRKQLWPNVVATAPGSGKGNDFIIVIAHLDSISDDPERVAPGADDDGSGVAAVLEIARVIRKVPLRRNVLLCLSSNEEAGARGSAAFANSLKMRAQAVRAVVNLDVIGYNSPRMLNIESALVSHKKLKHKVKALWKMFNNRLLSFRQERPGVRIAGRNEDAALVESTAKMFRSASPLFVKEIVGKGCG